MFYIYVFGTIFNRKRSICRRTLTLIAAFLSTSWSIRLWKTGVLRNLTYIKNQFEKFVFCYSNSACRRYSYYKWYKDGPKPRFRPSKNNLEKAVKAHKKILKICFEILCRTNKKLIHKLIQFTIWFPKIVPRFLGTSFLSNEKYAKIFSLKKTKKYCKSKHFPKLRVWAKNDFFTNSNFKKLTKKLKLALIILPSK